MTTPIQLMTISPESFPAWRERSSRDYESDLVVMGETAEIAQRRAQASLDGAFPEGHPTPENAVFDVIDDAGSTVGYLWVGRDTSDDSSAWWVWDIVINSEQRGRGLGRATMQAAESYARSRGARTLGLNVFGFNQTARSLYESLGYETTAIKMRKQL